MHHAVQDPVFVAMSIAVAVLGSWTSLELLHRVPHNVGLTRSGWLATAALAMGISIWSMHFVAMLGFDPGSPVHYDPLLTSASFLLAVCSTAAAFFLFAGENAIKWRVAAAGTLMGCGICAMHYVGMAAMTTASITEYDYPLVALSLAVALVASTTALVVAGKRRSALTQASASVILGLAVVGMHYTAMAASKIMPMAVTMEASGASRLVLAVAVAAMTVLLLSVAVMASLSDQREDVLSALEAGGVGYWDLDLRTKVLRISPKGKQIFGISPQEELSYAEALQRIAPDSHAERERQIAHAIRTGTDYDVEYPLALDGRWVNARGRTVGPKGKRPIRMVGVVLDVSERRHAFTQLEASERRQRLLIDELNHRVKNTLATVQSISRQTAKQSGSTEKFHTAFEARLMALSATHNALTRGNWEAASLREILNTELRPYAASQVEIIGDDIDLQSRTALAMGMVIHELATNAAKHGGLSVPDGRLRIRWEVADAQPAKLLRLFWSESGRPISEVPTSRGFGSRLIRTSIESELDGRAFLNFEREGLRCELLIPVGHRCSFFATESIDGQGLGQ